MKQNPLQLLHRVAQVIYDKKGFNTVALDVKGLSSITDYIVIAEGNVDRHVMSIARGILDELHEKGESPLHTEGLQSGDWIVLDFSDFVIHLFQPGLREKYSLEKLWEESSLVDLEIDTRAVGDRT